MQATYEDTIMTYLFVALSCFCSVQCAFEERNQGCYHTVIFQILLSGRVEFQRLIMLMIY
jgi:hypothetical protein